MDISAEEERILPLPKNWIRVMKPDGTARYKSTVTVVESEEHPYIVQSLNAARKCPLPPGWVVKETVSGDGSSDYYYCNPSLGLSMWDPPSLRSCLVEALRAAGQNAAADRIFANIPAGSEISDVYALEKAPMSPKTDISTTYQQFRMQQQLLSDKMASSPDKDSHPNSISTMNVPSNMKPNDIQKKQNQQWMSLRDNDMDQNVVVPVTYNSSGATENNYDKETISQIIPVPVETTDTPKEEPITTDDSVFHQQHQPQLRRDYYNGSNRLSPNPHHDISSSSPAERELEVDQLNDIMNENDQLPDGGSTEDEDEEDEYLTSSEESDTESEESDLHRTAERKANSSFPVAEKTVEPMPSPQAGNYLVLLRSHGSFPYFIRLIFF